MAQLTEAQQHQLIALLDEQEARLHRQLTELESVSPADAEPAVEPYEEVDLADLEASERAADMMRNHYRTELAQIVVARERLADGRYGLCVDCGEAIPFLRLQAQRQRNAAWPASASASAGGREVPGSGATGRRAAWPGLHAEAEMPAAQDDVVRVGQLEERARHVFNGIAVRLQRQQEVFLQVRACAEVVFQCLRCHGIAGRRTVDVRHAREREVRGAVLWPPWRKLDRFHGRPLSKRGTPCRLHPVYCVAS